MAGSGRSGTTWIAELIRRAAGGWLYFEPDHPRGRLEIRRDDPQQKRVAGYRLLAAGHYANNWSVRDVRSFLGRRRVVLKSVRATDLANELVAGKAVGKAVVVVRHPCAVIASRLSAPYFSPPAQSELRRRCAVQCVDGLDGLAENGSVLSRYALEWALDNHCVADGPDVLTVPYERALLQPDATLARIIDHLEVSVRTVAAEVMRAPSFTTRSGGLKPGAAQLAKWQTTINSDDAAEILAVVHRVGIEMYGADPLPRSRGDGGGR